MPVAVEGCSLGRPAEGQGGRLEMGMGRSGEGWLLKSSAWDVKGVGCEEKSEKTHIL